ncbi:MAG TPA: bifunctional pyr operon transcriptional regulator/uracil phosphoribosyltransferase PyrR [Acidiferrobacter sp.]|nr:bifunctional pyr operon transcriptional regulator/uracil phosphoribosyltransferase PyrR [Acidiferrobacter sp.]
MIDVEQALARMALGIAALKDRQPVMVGIHTGGVWVAERLHRRLGLADPLGTLDISFYRDDFSRVGINPQVKTSYLPIALDGRHIVLVDDVLHTGRTIRAALNEIFDFARPAAISLAALIVRDGRELPIQPDIVGAMISLRPGEHIKLTGPNPLGIKIMEKEE